MTSSRPPPSTKPPEILCSFPYVTNSTIVALAVTASMLLTSTLADYVFAKFAFFGKNAHTISPRGNGDMGCHGTGGYLHRGATKGKRPRLGSD